MVWCDEHITTRRAIPHLRRISVVDLHYVYIYIHICVSGLDKRVYRTSLRKRGHANVKLGRDCVQVNYCLEELQHKDPIQLHITG